ncbi:MAG: hypothetical protein BSOLF_1314 [Candidatus Carbobacillus altaicus]|uniref:Uncharacterized protein n=1 Tax=Candidatus Carbonibacillus altaicus TaxID=2163959 RepID=A0A2R6XZK1_9BACL|nr:MAG: hypothetical protein BSOLF_1314 [Candidatus Carbobacillus altaicus]
MRVHTFCSVRPSKTTDRKETAMIKSAYGAACASRSSLAY